MLRNEKMKTRKSILIADDEDLFGAILRRLLEQEGYTVSCCNKPSDAITLAQEINFDVILTDYDMPEMNGAELARSMRCRFTDSYIIGLSCLSMEAAFLAAGADAFLEKPVDYQKLLSLIRQAVAVAPNERILDTMSA